MNFSIGLGRKGKSLIIKEKFVLLLLFFFCIIGRWKNYFKFLLNIVDQSRKICSILFLLYTFTRSMNSHCQCFRKKSDKKFFIKIPPFPFSFLSSPYYIFHIPLRKREFSPFIKYHWPFKEDSFLSFLSFFYIYIFLQRKMNSHSSRSFREISTEAIEARFHPFPLSLIPSSPLFHLSYFSSFLFYTFSRKGEFSQEDPKDRYIRDSHEGCETKEYVARRTHHFPSRSFQHFSRRRNGRSVLSGNRFCETVPRRRTSWQRIVEAVM